MHDQEQQVLGCVGEMMNHGARSYAGTEKAFVIRITGSKIEYPEAAFRKNTLQQEV